MKFGELGGIGQKVVDWTHLTQDRNQWWALVFTLMNLRIL